jgi:hypothetical protein
VLLRHGPKSEADSVIKFCLETLSEALPGFPFVGPLQAMFCESVLSYGHAIPSNAETLMGGRRWQSFTREEKLDCCERLSYAQPTDFLVERLDPKIGVRFEAEWKSFIESHGTDNATMASTGDSEHENDSDEVELVMTGQSYRGSGDQNTMDISSIMNVRDEKGT